MILTFLAWWDWRELSAFSRLESQFVYQCYKENKHLDEIFMNYFKNVINIKIYISSI